MFGHYVKKNWKEVFVTAISFAGEFINSFIVLFNKYLLSRHRVRSGRYSIPKKDDILGFMDFIFY